MSSYAIMERRVSGGIEPETVQTQRPLPQTTLQFAGKAAEHVVGGLSGRSPYMLGIVILNLIGVAAAVFFLNLLISGQQQHLKTLVEQLKEQQTEIVTLHKQEFDQLLQLIPRGTAEPVPAGVPVPVTPLPQPGRR